MTRLIELTKKVQKHNDIKSLEIVLNLFEPKIKASLRQTSPQEQHDLYQELKHWAVQDKQNPTAFSQEQIDRVRGKMGVYAQSLRRASDLWVKETQSALKSIESYCAEIQSSSNAGAALPRKATRS